MDVVTTSPLLRASRFARRVDRVGTFDGMVEQAFDRIGHRDRPYDWVIAGDDETVRRLSHCAWPAGAEPKYLPRTAEGQASHLYSKIGLSRVLAAGGVKTPEFRVVNSCAECLAAARELGYPVLVKMDSASGGVGVHRCENDQDTRGLAAMFGSRPLLVQRWIAGQELDLSAIYFDRKLVHFNYSEILRKLPGSALSTVRRYSPLPLVDEEVFDELAELGRVLDANGFVSISCMEAADGSGRYYFEADMRPNVWVDFSRFYGEDSAARIRKWFAAGETLSKQSAGKPEGCTPVTIPYFLRVPWWELALNRYRVWRFIPWNEPSLVLRMLGSRAAMPLVRFVVPHGVRRWVKRGMIGAGIAFP